MTVIRRVQIRGESSLGTFGGVLELHDGLNVISARNAYGKTTATTAVPWVLGLEPMFGLQNGDASRFPAAVRDVISVGGRDDARVVASRASVTLERDGGTLTLERAIAGGDSAVATATLNGEVYKLNARKRAMVDETGGLQRFLFDWFGFARASLKTTQGRTAEIYLENLAPLFYVDQIEGWSDIQALQVKRYGLIDVSEAAFEYLLGAREALERRFADQSAAAAAGALKATAQDIADEVRQCFAGQGWTYEVSTHGTPFNIAGRWADVDLFAVAAEQFGLRFEREGTRLQSEIKRLREKLTQAPLDRHKVTASSAASQEVIDLKSARHESRQRLRDVRTEVAEQQSVLRTLTHRIQATRDLLRLKREGIGVLPQLECPTCHQSVEPSVLSLTEQSAASVETHLGALDRERQLIETNIESAQATALRASHELSQIEERLNDAQRALLVVTQAVGSQREELGKVANDLVKAERELERLGGLRTRLEALRDRMKEWVREASGEAAADSGEPRSDLAHRLDVFVRHLGAMLIALGHSEVSEANVHKLRLDERYTLYLGTRRLRSLGSASDHPRLVAAYALALAIASKETGGPHPGFVILDEPLQQNPDKRHRELMLHFLSHEARSLEMQLIVVTSLVPEEIRQLESAGVTVHQPLGPHFLALTSPPADGG